MRSKSLDLNHVSAPWPAQPVAPAEADRESRERRSGGRAEGKNEAGKGPADGEADPSGSHVDEYA